MANALIPDTSNESLKISAETARLQIPKGMTVIATQKGPSGLVLTFDHTNSIGKCDNARIKQAVPKRAVIVCFHRPARPERRRITQTVAANMAICTVATLNIS